MQLDLVMLGFGRVNRALAALLLRKKAVLTDEYDLTTRVTGIATHGHGRAMDPAGLDLNEALRRVRAGESLDGMHRAAPVADTLALLRACPADLVLEATWLDPHSGQPATDYAREALAAGRHVVTANKGPVAFAYRELSALARAHDRGFFFESTVMDGVPVHSMAREGLLATTVTRVRGILNSTTNYILTALEQGQTMDEAIAGAQRVGVAEADPSTDLEGWDAAVKIVVLANVLMGADLRPADVARQGITGLNAAEVRAALAAGERYKLLCEARRDAAGQVSASVRPVRLALADPLAQVNDTSSALTIETDTLKQITLLEGDSDPSTTAYGMLVDLINLARGRFRGLPDPARAGQRRGDDLLG